MKGLFLLQIIASKRVLKFMIIADIDIYRAAKMIIDKHGDDATSEALKKSAEFFASGDHEGGETWQKIARAACWMLNEETYEEEVIH